VLNIDRTHTAVVACYASSQALDSLPPALPGTHECRVARDELLLVAPPTLLAETERWAAEHFASVEPSALVLDQSDGWSAFTLRGDEAPSVFAQLSELPLPMGRQAFIQGAVAGGSAKILLNDDMIHVLVPSTLRHNLADRLRDVCGGRAVVPDTEIAFVSDSATPSYRDRATTPALP
jgi:hypothetical protein